MGTAANSLARIASASGRPPPTSTIASPTTATAANFPAPTAPSVTEHEPAQPPRCQVTLPPNLPARMILGGPLAQRLPRVGPISSRFLASKSRELPARILLAHACA